MAAPRDMKPNSLIRLVALLLVPCLLVEPVLASGPMPGLERFTARSGSPQGGPPPFDASLNPPSVFSSQALELASTQSVVPLAASGKIAFVGLTKSVEEAALVIPQSWWGRIFRVSGMLRLGRLQRWIGEKIAPDIETEEVYGMLLRALFKKWIAEGVSNPSVQAVELITMITVRAQVFKDRHTPRFFLKRRAQLVTQETHPAKHARLMETVDADQEWLIEALVEPLYKYGPEQVYVSMLEDIIKQLKERHRRHYQAAKPEEGVLVMPKRNPWDSLIDELVAHFKKEDPLTEKQWNTIRAAIEKYVTSPLFLGGEWGRNQIVNSIRSQIALIRGLPAGPALISGQQKSSEFAMWTEWRPEDLPDRALFDALRRHLAGMSDSSPLHRAMTTYFGEILLRLPEAREECNQTYRSWFGSPEVAEHLWSDSYFRAKLSFYILNALQEVGVKQVQVSIDTVDTIKHMEIDKLKNQFDKPNAASIHLSIIDIALENSPYQNAPDRVHVWIGEVSKNPEPAPTIGRFSDFASRLSSLRADRKRRPRPYLLSTALWPGQLLADVLKGPEHLAQRIAAHAWDHLEGLSMDAQAALALAKTGQLGQLSELIIDCWGGATETIAFLEDPLSLEMATYSKFQGLKRGKAESAARELIDPLLEAWVYSHANEVFRKGEDHLSPPTEAELRAILEKAKEWAQPLYRLFTEYYSLPYRQRNAKFGLQHLLEALQAFTNAHNRENKAIRTEDRFPAGTAYAISPSPRIPSLNPRENAVNRSA
jgi:hypothetical protein